MTDILLRHRFKAYDVPFGVAMRNEVREGKKRTARYILTHCYKSVFQVAVL
jgi:hypothetical protein